MHIDFTTLYKVRYLRGLLCLFFVFWAELQAFSTDISRFAFKHFSELDNLSSKDIQSIYQDRDGFMWIATRNGLFQFDGYEVTVYKTNEAHSSLLTDNNVTCMTEDAAHRLWVGTSNGLNVLDKTTGTFRQYGIDKVNFGSIAQLLVTRTGRLLVGADNGLYEYQSQSDDFLRIQGAETGGVYTGGSIKALMEDAKGDIWIGTWSSGLYRQEAATGRYYKYPQMNERNSAHVLFQDSRQRIWVGVWDGGLQLLHDAYRPEHTTWTTFQYDEKRPTSLSDNLVYALAEDLETHTLWVGTRHALSILPLHEQMDASAPFQHYYADESDNTIAESEVAALLRDRQGLMWVGMIGGGVNVVDTRSKIFGYNPLSAVRHMLHTASVRSMYQDDDGKLWMGIGSSGFGILDEASGRFQHCMQLEDFKAYPAFSSTVRTIMQSPSTGHVWIGVYDGGLFEYDRQAPAGRRVKHYLSSDKDPWLCGDCIYHVYEDSTRNIWAATRTGISVRRADGRALRLDSLKVNGTFLRDMICLQTLENARGDMWVATERHGVVRIQGSGSNWRMYRTTLYTTDSGKLNHNHVQCLFKDSRGRIWVGSAGTGLNLYDEATDSFLPVHSRWNLPGDAVVSILEGTDGALWIGTNVGLLKLKVKEYTEASFHLYTMEDGLQENIFNAGAAFCTPDGEMYFGGLRGYNRFYPGQLQGRNFFSRAVLTDFKIFNHSWKNFPEEDRNAISSHTPLFARKVVLDHWHNNLQLQFSALEYVNPQLNRYAYRLDGFEKEWQFADASNRFAAYNNLQPGDYTFRLRSSNSNGIWNQDELQMAVTVLPPPWKTWWAYLIYLTCIAGVVWYFYRVARNRMRLQNALHLREVEKEKAEELNHAKLQFFTNITHELLTPLTILSASVDELKQLAPAYRDQYRVMNNNISRLIRLLQQILEFRKAETGNLKLKVSLGDMVQFIHRSLDSFRPLMQQKNIHFEFHCQEESFITWFDADKMDKVLYNLLSNAAKYSRSGETVAVILEAGTDGFLRLTVKDNGPGIPKEDQKNLFKRFYEGDYRKFNTIGTGIGLSLVRDLVTLHHGTVTVESEAGKGTAFIIQLPMAESDYSQPERDASSLLPGGDSLLKEVSAEDSIPAGTDAQQPVTAASVGEKLPILLVEDNEELLELMLKLLQRDYIIYTAIHGKKAIEVLQAHEISLIVSDVMMPEMDGIELCRYVKSHIEWSHIPVLLLTAKNQEEDRVQAYESGADGFITKPFSLSVLHARIVNLLRARQQKRTEFKNQLVFEAKELDYTSIDEEFLKQAVDCVNRHLDDPDFDLPQFLEEMNSTKSTCFRKLKSLTGLTFVSFVRNIRMKAACRIMEEKKHIRISELAYAVGYNDPRYFSSSFKKEMGMQPSEYMEKFTQDGKIEE